MGAPELLVLLVPLLILAAVAWVVMTLVKRR
jgi:hypothetical protein